MKRLLCSCFALLLVLPGFVHAQDDNRQAAVPVFESDIVPLSKKHCWKCHSARSSKEELSLQTLDGFLRGACIMN